MFVERVQAPGSPQGSAEYRVPCRAHQNPPPATQAAPATSTSLHPSQNAERRVAGILRESSAVYTYGESRWRESMSGLIAIGIVHSSPLLRESLQQVLTQQREVGRVSAFGSAQEVVEHPIAESHVLLYEWRTAKQDGTTSLTDLHDRVPQAKILMFNVANTDQAVIECVVAGAAGCILEEASLDELLDGIQQVCGGRPALSPRCIRSLFSYVMNHHLGDGHTAHASLTRREEEILRLVAAGLSNKEIAQRLYLQPQTVKNYVHQILQKLGLHRRREVMQVVSTE